MVLFVLEGVGKLAVVVTGLSYVRLLHKSPWKQGNIKLVSSEGQLAR